MDLPFQPFASALSRRQVSLLLDAALFFEDAPKLLSVPDESGERVPLPIVPETLRAMLQELDGADPDAAARFAFAFVWMDADQREGELVVTLPSGRVIRQPARLDRFSPV